jgi:hypothetical protein
MRHSYQMKGTLLDTPQWWQNFVNSFDEDELDKGNVLRDWLYAHYNATLRCVNDELYILQFDNDEGHLMFMMKWR